MSWHPLNFGIVTITLLNFYFSQFTLWTLHICEIDIFISLPFKKKKKKNLLTRSHMTRTFISNIKNLKKKINFTQLREKIWFQFFRERERDLLNTRYQQHLLVVGQHSTASVLVLNFWFESLLVWVWILWDFSYKLKKIQNIDFSAISKSPKLWFLFLIWRFFYYYYYYFFC